ncbi:type II toxin-antitoxin system Phd/YefM family antitoxin [Leifsonia poae]|uniref:type II toxin-antitoxin system Phd/YefM family antitoxin n=1 Tax=Leifsonia poae TaxID=110933 RepID=UPI003D69D2AA
MTEEPQAKEITVGQLRQNPTRMLADVQDGAVYTITTHGRPIADVVPHSASAWAAIDEVRDFLARPGDVDWANELEGHRAEQQMRDPWA